MAIYSASKFKFKVGDEVSHRFNKERWVIRSRCLDYKGKLSYSIGKVGYPRLIQEAPEEYLSILVTIGPSLEVGDLARVKSNPETPNHGGISNLDFHPDWIVHDVGVRGYYLRRTFGENGDTLGGLRYFSFQNVVRSSSQPARCRPPAQLELF